MDLALIDDDSLYQSVFKDFFDESGVEVIQFSCGRDFVNSPSDIVSKIKYIVVDHSVLGTTTTEIINLIKERIDAKICLISTYGRAVINEGLENLDICGDFKKKDLNLVMNWYNYLKGDIEKELQFDY